MGDIRNQIEAHVIILLDGNTQGYKSGHKICGGCKELLPRGSTCCSTNKFSESCTSESRVGTYFSSLKSVGLWPFEGLIQTLSGQTVIDHVSTALANWTHVCDAEPKCPAWTAFTKLYASLQEQRIRPP